tara:strand:+ start:1840 stop:2868 length:1029 start_codon:yes stop_codon:yes gene_type:complete
MSFRDFQTQINSKIDSSQYVDAYRWMFLARSFEDKMGALYRAGKVVGGVYLGRGQEAFSVALGMQLARSSGDVYGGGIRDQAGRMAFGEALLDGAQTYLGSVKGPMRGRDGNIHRGRPENGMPAMISHLGGSVSIINGMLIGKRFKGESSFVGGVTAGDGSTSTGAFHEGLNQAAVEKLPLVVAIADNQFAYSTPTDRQYACENLVERAQGYGVAGFSIDGTDLAECLVTFRTAIDRAREGQGPQLVVGKLLRLAGHGEHDDASYVPESARAAHWGRDCLKVARKKIQDEGWSTLEHLTELEEEAQDVVEKTVAQAQAEDFPDPAKDDWRALSSASLTEGEG